MKLIAPSILSADFSKLGDEVEAVEKAGADWIHVDVMDGHFVPNITMGPLVVKAVKRVTSLPIDVHLMIENPEHFIADFARAGADFISIQIESCIHLNRAIQMIREEGVRAGVVLNPSTSINLIEWVIKDLDYVLLMSVNPGFGGQSFIPSSIKKIKALKDMVKSADLSTLIEIDGGINERTIVDASDAGVDVFVAGSAIFGTENYEKTISKFKKLISG